MKKKLIMLGVCSLGYLYSVNSFGAAAVFDEEKEKMFSSTKAICEDVAPKIATKIGRYTNARKEAEELVSALDILGDHGAPGKISRSLALAQEADRLVPEIAELSKTFFGTLATLDEKYEGGSQQILTESFGGGMKNYYALAAAFANAIICKKEKPDAATEDRPAAAAAEGASAQS